MLAASLVVAVCFLCCTVPAQSKASQPVEPAKAKRATPAIPVFNVKLSPNPDLSAPYDDRMFSNSQGCDSDGNPYIRVYKLFPHEISILKFSSKQIVTFSAHQITDVVEPDVVDDFVLDSGLFMLVKGDIHQEQKTKQYDDGSQGTYFEAKGEPKYYIARFDGDGSYKGVYKLDLPFQPTRLSGFESGNFIAAGYDDAKIWRVALLDASGTLLKYVDFPKEKEKSPDKEFERSFGLTAADGADTFFFAALASFFPYHGQALYLRGHSGSPIYEISEAGEATRVRIKGRNGEAADGFIPSDRNWLVVFGETGKLPTRETGHLYEVEMSTGNLSAEYRVEQNSRFADAEQQVACIYQGEFRGFRHEKGKLVMLHGMPEAATTNSKPASPAVQEQQ
jgi:hypothetical protein